MYVMITLRDHADFKRLVNIVDEKAQKRVTYVAWRTFKQSEGKDPASGTKVTTSDGSPADSPIDNEPFEVYHIAAPSATDPGSTRTTWTNMNFEDHTSRVLHVGSHGTLCKRPLGDKSTFSLRYTQHPTCYEGLLAIMQTPSYTDGRFVLPAHEFDVTLESVDTPDYNQVTDADANGFFHRLRQRTQRVDLFEEPDSETPHYVEWQYRPKPMLSISFPTSPKAKLECTVTDGKEQSPAFSFSGGKIVKVVVAVKEVLAGGRGECDHVPGIVQVHSKLGLSTADMAALNLPNTSAKHVQMQEVLEKSLFGSKNETLLRKCASAVDPACGMVVQHTPVRKTLNFGADYECTRLANGDKPSGFSPLTDAAGCVEEWAKVRQQPANAYPSWYTMGWNTVEGPSLTGVQRAAWLTCGANRSAWNATASARPAQKPRLSSCNAHS